MTLLVAGTAAAAQEPSSTFVFGKNAEIGGDVAVLDLRIIDRKTKKPLPARLTIKDAAGTFVDGSGRGVYADGRFFVDGATQVKCSAGKASISVSSGPEYVPFTTDVELAAGFQRTIEVQLHQWFSASARGWYCGDNHVHAQHDRTAAIKTDLDYTALQSRANGLDYMTEAGSHGGEDEHKDLSREDFIFGAADEIRPGIFIGHLNTPGIREPLDKTWYERVRKEPLPVQKIKAKVRELGGVTIHTHPLTPRHQLHWMGAAELWSDMVHGDCADAIDVDNLSCEMLVYAALNLGNKVAVSGYTDAALGRTKTKSPGDRRVYALSGALDYEKIIKSIRAGKTFATNGGPVFPFIEAGGSGPGGTYFTRDKKPVPIKVEVFSLHELEYAHLIRGGAVVERLDVKGQRNVALTVDVDPGDSTTWLLLRTRDRRGNWAVTSPIHFVANPVLSVRKAAAALFEINNTARGMQLRQQFHAHAIVSVSKERGLTAVSITRDGKPWKTFDPGSPSKQRIQTPVTAFGDGYGPGHQFVHDGGRAIHFQADWPVTESGWYALTGTTRSGVTISTDAVYFDAASPVSHALSSARLVGPRTELILHGYGEEMPLVDITLPFEGDHWWYPKNAYSMMIGTFNGHTYKEGPWGDAKEGKRFKGK
jgi:hypothetical protein